MNRIDEFRMGQLIADLIVETPNFDNDLLNKLSKWMRAYLDSLPYDEEDERIMEAHMEAIGKARGILQIHLMTICPQMGEQIALDVADLIAHDLG